MVRDADPTRLPVIGDLLWTSRLIVNRPSEELRESILRGVEEADNGELEDVDDGIMDRIRAAGQRILSGISQD